VQRFLPVASLDPNESLDLGEYVESPDERFRLVYQSDGNLVLYRVGVGALWSSQTSGSSAGYAIMQTDGNLVVDNASETAVWSSNTSGNDDAILAVQSDGNLVIYSDYYNEVFWQTNTDGY